MSLFRPRPPTPHEHLLPRCAELAPIIGKVHADMMGVVPRKLLVFLGRQLDLVRGDSLVFDSAAQETLLYDHCIYRQHYKKSTMARRYSRDILAVTAPGDMALVLEAMARAAYRLLAIESVEKGVGVEATDVLRGGRFFLMDRLVDKCARPGRVLAGTVVDLPDFAVTPSVLLPLPPDAGQMAAVLRENPAFSEGFRRNAAAINPDDETLLAGMLLGAANRTDMPQFLDYIKRIPLAKEF